MKPFFAFSFAFCGLVCAALSGLPARAQKETVAELPRRSPIVYVALNGSDAWTGKLPAPNKTRTDGPFRTLVRAQQAVRPEIQTENRATHTITVQIRGGVYELPAPLTFTKADSGTTVTPILWEAYPSEKPVLSGGRVIKNWKQTAPGKWETTLPEVASGKWYFEQLTVNGARRYRPRLPKNGYYFIAGDLPPTPANKDKGFDQFRYAKDEIHADWHNLTDVQVLAFQVWTMARLPIASVKAAEKSVTFSGTTRGLQAYSSLPRGNRYIVENVKEALTEPGEWYLDRKTGVLTYLARPGENPDEMSVVAPRLDCLLNVSDAQFLTFRGLQFSHSAWNTPPTGNAYPQAEINVPASVQLSNAQNVSFSDCSITHTGNYGISFENGCTNDAFNDGAILDTGGGGVKIGETAIRANVSDDKQTGRIIIQNNLIAHGGRVHPASVGVWIGQSARNTIAHNEIADFYYTGISPGWTWGYAKSGAHDNTIAYNRIHDIGQGVLSDMGGVYTLGVSQGTVLDHNVIHDISSFDYGGWGIYFDEGTTNVVAKNNIAYRTKSAPFHQHYGKDNLVSNNIFAWGGEAQLMRTRPEDHKSFTIEGNIILYAPPSPLLGSNWSGTPGVNWTLDRNLYWNTGGPDKVTFNGTPFPDWQSKGSDKNSIIADPLFVAPERGDFRLRPGSPASKIGFVPIDTSRVGRMDVTQEEPVAVSRAFPPPPPPQPIADDFEATPVGAKPGGPGVSVSEDVSTSAPNAHPATAPVIRVTDETAFGGKQSLKVTDAPGQKFSYLPLLVYQPKVPFDTGETVTGTFAFRRETGAVFYHEWRDSNSGSGYHVGPTIRVTADGRVSASGKPLSLTLPIGAWVKITLVCKLGSGTYSLTIAPQNQPAQTFSDLPCPSGQAFNALQWWGFVADGNEVGVFYLDDVSLTQK